MKGLAAVLLVLLTGGSHARFPLAERIRALLAEQMGEVKHLEVRLHTLSPAQKIVGDLEEATIALRGFDASRLPVKSLLPHPKERILKGRIRRLRVEGREAKVQDFLFSSLTLEVTDLRYDLLGLLARKEVLLTDFGTSRVEARLGEEELLRYAREKLPSIEDIALDFQGGSPGRVVVRGKATLGLLSLDLTLTTGLKVVEGHRVELHQPHLEAGGIVLPPAMAERSLASINPILDLHTLLEPDTPLVLDRIEITDNEVILLGHLEFALAASGSGKEGNHAWAYRALRRAAQADSP